jgi:hypothetical protein
MWTTSLVSIHVSGGLAMCEDFHAFKNFEEYNRCLYSAVESSTYRLNHHCQNIQYYRLNDFVAIRYTPIQNNINLDMWPKKECCIQLHGGLAGAIIIGATASTFGRRSTILCSWTSRPLVPKYLSVSNAQQSIPRIKYASLSTYVLTLRSVAGSQEGNA